jgi:hypothetical protein
VIVSYDMRPAPSVLRSLRAWRARPSAAPVTPTTPIGLNEVRRLWPAGELRHRTVGVLPELAALAGRARWIAELCSVVPPARTHLIATVRKPG